MAMRRSEGVVFERSGDRAVLLDEAGSTLFTLNPVGSLVWHELDGARDASELAAALVGRFDGAVEIAQLEADISDFLAEMMGEGLIVDVRSPDAPS